MQSNILTALEVTLRYGDTEVFEDLNFRVLKNSKVGLVGRNGSGKTSLMKIIAGVLEADGGDMYHSKDLRVAYLQQEFEYDSELTVAEFLYSAGTKSLEEYALYEERLHDLSQYFQVADSSKKISELSGGQQRQLFLLKTLAQDADITLLDEPTNHLDLITLERIQNLLKDWPKTLIIISHDRYFIDHIAEEIWEIDRGDLFIYSGNYSTYLERHQQRVQFEDVINEKRNQELKRELEWVRSGVKARGTKDQGRLNRFFEMETEFKKRKKKPAKLELPIPKPQPLGDKIVITEQLRVDFPHLKHTPLIDDFSIIFEPGMRLGILGPNGSGKTTLIKTLMGTYPKAGGTIRYGETVVFNYQDQKRMRLPMEVSLKEVISEGNNEMRFGERKMNVYAYLKKFLFDSKDLDKSVGSLSGGQRARLVLAKILKEGGNFLILDEPTNDLDLDMLQSLENTLLKFNGCVILVSHDRFFLDQVCTHLLVLEGDGKYRLLNGGYTRYVQKYGLQSSVLKETAEVDKNPKAQKKLTKKQTGKSNATMRAELREIEKRMVELRMLITVTESQFALPEFYKEAGETRVARKLKQLEERKQELEDLETQWLELSDLIS